MISRLSVMFFMIRTVALVNDRYVTVFLESQQFDTKLHADILYLVVVIELC